MQNTKPQGPLANIDGTPMAGDSGVDVHGNPYGVTDTSCDDISMNNSIKDYSTDSYDDFSCSSSDSFDDLSCSTDSFDDSSFDSFSDDGFSDF